MKILVLDEEFPWPLNTGKRIRSYHLHRGLAKRHDLTYLAFGRRESEGYVELSQQKMNPVPVEISLPSKSGMGFYYRLAKNVFSPYPYSVDNHFQPEFERALEAMLRKHHYDVVLCEWTPYARYVLQREDLHRVVASHNIEAQIWVRYAGAQSSRLRRAYLASQAVKMERFERQVFGTVEAATAVSESDAETIRGYNHRLSVEVIDNGVDLEYFRPADESSAISKPNLVFTGSMDWRPNQDAAIFFVRRVLPLLRDKFSDITFTIVGRNPSISVRDLEKVEGVTVTGTVDDVRPYIDKASIYVVPLRVGGGSRLKILEALAMRKPVISTTVGAEGLDLRVNEHLLVADEPQDWIETVENILTDREKASAMGKAGRRLVEQRYGWPALVNKLDRFLHRQAGIS